MVWQARKKELAAEHKVMERSREETLRDKFKLQQDH